MFDRKPTRDDLIAASAFERFGARIVPNLIEASELGRLRQEIDGISRSGAGRHIQAPELFQHLDLLEVMFRSRLVEALRSIFGRELCYYPNVQVQMNSFTQLRAGSYGGWHIDASQEAADGRDYLFTREPLWANVGVFFQDAHNAGYGGGIMIIPGSHRFFSRMRRFPRWAGPGHKVLSRLMQALPTRLSGMVVPTLPGDAVIFDGRLMHTSIPTSRLAQRESSLRGAQRQGQAWVDSIPRDHHKYAMYWFCSNVRFASTCLENNFYSRASLLSEDYARNGGFDYHRVCRVAEGTYPPGLVALAEAREVQLASRHAA